MHLPTISDSTVNLSPTVVCCVSPYCTALAHTGKHWARVVLVSSCCSHGVLYVAVPYSVMYSPTVSSLIVVCLLLLYLAVHTSPGYSPTVFCIFLLYCAMRVLRATTLRNQTKKRRRKSISGAEPASKTPISGTETALLFLWLWGDTGGIARSEGEDGEGGGGAREERGGAGGEGREARPESRQVSDADCRRCEIKYKKTQPQYNLYQECDFLYLISGCASAPAVCGTDLRYDARIRTADCGTELGYGARVEREQTRTEERNKTECLVVCACTMRGTDTYYVLCAYALPSTDAYVPMRYPVLTCGTEY
eukprot:1345129-Rhodomonas_salina.4